MPSSLDDQKSKSIKFEGQNIRCMVLKRCNFVKFGVELSTLHLNRS